MTQHNRLESCPACVRLADIRTDPSYICELGETFVVLHAHQFWPGWCVLLLKGHAEHLHELDAARHVRVMADVQVVAQAVVRATGCRRINYECLGNQLAHVHWHVVPRFAAPDDPEPLNAVWVRPKAELEAGVTPERREKLIWALRSAGLEDQG